jgi:hypothetical protein
MTDDACREDIPANDVPFFAIKGVMNFTRSPMQADATKSMSAAMCDRTNPVISGLIAIVKVVAFFLLCWLFRYWSCGR